MRRLILFSLLALLVMPGSAFAAQQKSVSFKKVSVSSLNGREGFGRTLQVPPQWTDQQYQALRTRFATVNPPGFGEKQLTPAPPFNRPTGAPDNYPALNSQGANRPLWGEGAEPLPGGSQAAASSVLVTTPVAQGSDGASHALTSTIAEPSIAGVPGALIYTGNWHAALSDTDGLSWQYLDPQNMFPASDGAARSDSGLCCDQLALSERSTSSRALTVWLGQSGNVSAADGNRLRLLTFEGPDELMEQRGYCSTDLTPQGAGYDNSTMYDFNQIARSKDWLYVTTNVYDLSPDDDSDTDLDSQKSFRESRIIRVDWSDLKAGDCSPYVESAAAPYGFTLSPAQGSDDKSTMYLASHYQIQDREGRSLGDGLVVYRVKDSRSSFDQFFVDVKDYPQSSRGDLSCPLPDGSDACLRSDDRITTGFRVDNRIGFLWNSAAGGGYAHPHIRGAVINLDTEKVSFEQAIHNSDFAWIYPAVQVSSSAEVGMTAYKAGGGDYTRARSFLVKSPKSSSAWSGMQSQGIVSSTHGVARNVWGDYSTISAYPGCSRTFAAAVWSMQGGDNDTDSQHRFAWFGESGCPNLKTERVAYLPLSVKPGGDVAVGATARNSGSASAGSSRSYVYLSSDPERDSSDHYLGSISHASLSAGASQAKSGTFTLPSLFKSGSYYVVSCADGGGSVSETSEADNCSASETMLSVARDPLKLDAGNYKVNISELAQGSGRNHPLIEQSIITRDIPSLIKLQPVIETYVSTKPVFSSKAILLAKSIPRPPVRPAQAEQPNQQPGEPVYKELPDGTTELPLDKASLDLGKLKTGRYFVFSCLRPAKRKVIVSDCVGVGQVNRVGFRKAKPNRQK